MGITRIEGCLLALRPLLTATLDVDVGRPRRNSLFVVAELVHDGRMFDKHGFERRWVTRDLIIAESSNAIGEEIDASGIGGLG